MSQVVALDPQELGMLGPGFGSLLGLRILFTALDACLDNAPSVSNESIRVTMHLAAGAFYLWGVHVCARSLSHACVFFKPLQA